MSSLKFLIVLCMLVNLPMIAVPTCESVNCKRCMESIIRQNLEDDREVRDFCIENGDKMVEDKNRQSATYDVLLQIYNLTDKMEEAFPDNPHAQTDAEDNIYKTLVVYGKEFSLLTSMGLITQNDPAKSPLGKPIGQVSLGGTKLNEQQFLDYLESLDMEKFKDENFDEHLNDIIKHLLSN